MIPVTIPMPKAACYTPELASHGLEQADLRGGGEQAVDALMDTCVDLAEIFTPPEGEELEKIIETAKAFFEYAAPGACREIKAVAISAQTPAADDDLPF